MKELVVISGKGGTGKTSIVASLAQLAENKVMADCDVDASDLHIILDPRIITEHPFEGGKTAIINDDLCTLCGHCESLCRFRAIEFEDMTFRIDPLSCEGCGVCAHFCPYKAITMKRKTSGKWFHSETRFGPMVHAALNIAEDNSGKLVTLVKTDARKIAEEQGYGLVIVDGSPGIGCPVIATISGAHIVLIVTEPTLSGIHDLKRVIELTRHFRIRSAVCVNKFDINEEMTSEIESFCREADTDVLAKIPYDTDFVDAQVNNKNILEYANSETTEIITRMWEKLSNAFN